MQCRHKSLLEDVFFPIFIFLTQCQLSKGNTFKSQLISFQTFDKYSSSLCQTFFFTDEKISFHLSFQFEDDSKAPILYCTGDYVKMKRENRMLYYEGRCDSQIKVRGHRVDLSEIQLAVEKINGVDKAVVLCYKPNEPAQKVICFFTSEILENGKVLTYMTLICIC